MSLEEYLFKPNSPCHITKRNLPHWSQASTLAFVTFRLHDSMPEERIDDYKKQISIFEDQYPEPRTKEQEQLVNNYRAKSLEKYLDAGYGSCILAQPKVRQQLVDTLHFLDNTSYHLLSYVVMPNHVHILFCIGKDKNLQEIIGEIKRVSARKITTMFNVAPPIWQREYFDRLIRTENQLRYIIKYIQRNPLHCQVSSFTLYEGEEICNGII
jgi:REP element-mobilizing transposase RayT